MTGGTMGVEFVMERTVKGKDGDKATLDVLINEYGKTTLPYASKSGGEKVKTSLAVILALAEIKTSAAGIQLGMLFIDEPPFLDEDGTQAYSDLYYGQRKVSEVVIVNDYPGNPEYPDDKIYIRPYYGDEVWALPGGDEVAPTGYNVYFKHNGIVAPVETTMITEVNRDPQTSAVSITWRTNEGEYVTTQLLSVDAIYDVLRNLPEDVAESIASQVVVGDYEQTYQQLYDDIVVNHTKSPLGGMSWEPISQ